MWEDPGKKDADEQEKTEKVQQIECYDALQITIFFVWHKLRVCHSWNEVWEYKINFLVNLCKTIWSVSDMPLIQNKYLNKYFANQFDNYLHYNNQLEEVIVT